jgi:hypothetical protein
MRLPPHWPAAAEVYRREHRLCKTFDPAYLFAQSNRVDKTAAREGICAGGGLAKILLKPSGDKARRGPAALDIAWASACLN